MAYDDTYPKTADSPKITAYSSVMSGAITGVFDLIKITGDTGTDTATIDVIPLGSSSATTIKPLAGDVVEGPFTSIYLTALSMGVDIFVYERSKLSNAS